MKKNIRSFLYLDNYKMYSISSQIFEGLTEYIMKNKVTTITDSESQKAPFGSGRILGSIVGSEIGESEKRFLYDYSYNLFEQELIDSNKVLEIDASNILDNAAKISDFSFVKIKGRIVFNDLKIIEETFSEFNSVGEALGYITEKANYDAEVGVIDDQIKGIKDRNQKSKARNLLNSRGKFTEYLKEKGLQLDANFLKHMSYILNYGYNQQFEVQMPINSANGMKLFSAQLNRDFLKDDEKRIIKKYSRATEKEFTLLGIVTQMSDNRQNIMQSLITDSASNMKEAIMNIVYTLGNVEDTFTGKLNYEYIIDPIALYLEI